MTNMFNLLLMADGGQDMRMESMMKFHDRDTNPGGGGGGGWGGMGTYPPRILKVMECPLPPTISKYMHRLLHTDIIFIYLCPQLFVSCFKFYFIFLACQHICPVFPYRIILLLTISTAYHLQSTLPK